MTELTVHFDLSFGRRSLQGLMIAVMFFSAVTELASENVSLITYYPAPMGAYTQMITTGNAFLARDGGNVGIGTAVPKAKLDVAGSVKISGGVAVGNGVQMGDDTAACTPTKAGTQRWHSGSLQLCDGNQWSEGMNSLWVGMPPDSQQGPDHIYWLTGNNYSPDQICKNAGYATFAGACRFTFLGKSYQGTLLSNEDTYGAKNWAIACQWGRTVYYMNPEGQILCIR